MPVFLGSAVCWRCKTATVFCIEIRRHSQFVLLVTHVGVCTICALKFTFMINSELETEKRARTLHSFKEPTNPHVDSARAVMTKDNSVTAVSSLPFSPTSFKGYIVLPSLMLLIRPVFLFLLIYLFLLRRFNLIFILPLSVKVEYDCIHPEKKQKKKSYKNSGIVKIRSCTVRH